MKPDLRRATITAFAAGLASCTTAAEPPPFLVVIRDPSCALEVNGRTVSMDELRFLAQVERKSRETVRIVSGSEVPYRCIGGVIYTLQSEGIELVDFLGKDLKRR
jgi:biopolymer transport protein ExbD